MIKYILTQWSYLFVCTSHHFMIIIMQTSHKVLKFKNACQDSFCLECVSKMKSILSIIFHAKYGALRIQLTLFFYDDYENMCTLSYYHHQIGSITHLPLFRVRLGHETIVCAVCLLIFLWAFLNGNYAIYISKSDTGNTRSTNHLFSIISLVVHFARFKTMNIQFL